MAAEIVGQARPGVGEAGVEDHRGDDGMHGAWRGTRAFWGSSGSISLVNIGKISAAPLRRQLAIAV